jgi:hypothetical protein
VQAEIKAIRRARVWGSARRATVRVVSFILAVVLVVFMVVDSFVSLPICRSP